VFPGAAFAGAVPVEVVVVGLFVVLFGEVSVVPEEALSAFVAGLEA
jgi:hypothetical protein